MSGPQMGMPQYGQPQYGQPQYGQPQYGQPVVPSYGAKPPLTPRMKRSATGAGVLGFLLMTWGWTLFLIAVGIGLFAGLAGSLIAAASSSDPSAGSEIQRQLTGAHLTVLVVPLIIVGVVGAGLWIIGLVSSKAILRRGGHTHPWGITWTGLLIAIVINAVLSFIGSIIANVVASFALQGAPSAIEGLTSGNASSLSSVLSTLGTTGVIFGIVSIVVSFVVTLLLGGLCWRWMAHAMRPAVSPGTQPATFAAPNYPIANQNGQ